MNAPENVEPTCTTCDAIQTAFELGWNLVELNARIRATLACGPDSSRRILGLWRVILFKIGTLHVKAFPDSTTKGTLFELPDKTPLFLFPSDAPDYVTINTAACPTDLDTNLQNFALYDTSRRAINCLCLLYLNPSEWLAGADVAAKQAALRSSLSQPALAGTSPEYAVGTFACKVLDAWNDYVREHYFAGGLIPNDDIELIAFEAGRTMASISWGVTVASVGIEIACNPEDAAKPASSEDSAKVVEATTTVIATTEESAEAQSASTGLIATVVSASAGFVATAQAGSMPTPDLQVAATKLEAAWSAAVRPESVIRLQYYISELSSALVAARAPANRLEALAAVKLSIDYWQRAVNEQKALFNSPPQANQGEAGGQADPQKAGDAQAQVDRIATWKKMRLALTRQANIWESLMIGQQGLGAFDVESVATRLVQSVWSDIQGDLGRQFSEVVNQTRAAADKKLELFYRKSLFYLIPLAAFLVLIAGVTALLVFSAQSSPDSKMAGIASFLSATGVGSAVVGAIGWIKSFYAQKQVIAPAEARGPASQAPVGGMSALFSHVEHTADDVFVEIQDAFKRGFQQLETQMASLSHGVAVSYPLVECLVMTQTLKTDVEFLKQVVWTGTDRIADMKAVISAALGPMWIFLGAGEEKR
ncbi:hypothetical protein [Paraburkholderia guartelaensis]|uniref:hypothetical protein n=1 Tax=Paraburkholderia guartelaensis TaxID=2546446 RepID=UPI002AB66B45|nr:hypothetical protein [Paraburkholderia guartelaensis]